MTQEALYEPATSSGGARGVMSAVAERPALSRARLARPPADGTHGGVLVTDHDVNVLRGILLGLVRRDGRDLTARQLTVFLTVYIEDDIHSVSSLANLLRISRPGITRVMDRLVQFELVMREEDQKDRRRVLVRRTLAGAAFCEELLRITRDAAQQVRNNS